MAHILRGANLQDTRWKGAKLGWRIASNNYLEFFPIAQLKIPLCRMVDADPLKLIWSVLPALEFEEVRLSRVEFGFRLRYKS